MERSNWLRVVQILVAVGIIAFCAWQAGQLVQANNMCENIGGTMLENGICAAVDGYCREKSERIRYEPVVIDHAIRETQ